MLLDDAEPPLAVELLTIASSFVLLLLLLELAENPLNLDEDFLDTLEPVPETMLDADDEDVELFECFNTRLDALASTSRTPAFA